MEVNEWIQSFIGKDRNLMACFHANQFFSSLGLHNLSKSQPSQVKAFCLTSQNSNSWLPSILQFFKSETSVFLLDQWGDYGQPFLTLPICLIHLVDVFHSFSTHGPIPRSFWALMDGCEACPFQRKKKILQKVVSCYTGPFSWKEENFWTMHHHNTSTSIILSPF